METTGRYWMVEQIDIPETNIMWCSVPLAEILGNNTRFEARAFSVAAKNAQETIAKCKFDKKALYGDDAFTSVCYYPGRFKRNYISKIMPQAIGFLGSSEMLDLKPFPEKFLSKEQNDIDSLFIKQGDLLLSRSGTIGNVAFVSRTLSQYLCSEHSIRLRDISDPGYIYAFLKTDIGQVLVKTNTFGSVVNQIEPDHLRNILIPNPPEELKKEIHNLVVKSYDLRDESNDLIDEAEKLLVDELKLPPLEDFKPKYFDKTKDIRNYEVSLSNLNNRFDSSYHIPLVDCIKEHLSKYAESVTTIGDKNVSEDIILPGRFARTYVEEGQGTLFFGGKEINQNEPYNKKYLSISKHNSRIEKELKLKENMVLITRSGTIGRVNIVPHHWENWVINEHVIRILPHTKEIAGYIYCWLNTEYGDSLIKRYTYGSVVNEIDTSHVANIPFPILKNKEIQTKINNLVLEANKKRYEAYILEQQAIKMVNEKVIYA